MRLNFCLARGVRSSSNTRSADFNISRLILCSGSCFLNLTTFNTPSRIPSDLSNRVNGWSYERRGMGILSYLGPPKGVPSAVLTQARSK